MAREPVDQDGRLSPVSSEPGARLDLEILRSLRRIIRAIDIYSHKLRATCQLTAPQLICLLSVVEQGPLSVSAISKSVFLSPSTIVGILDRLEERGLVIRERNNNDRRIVTVSATDDGTKLAAVAPSPLQDNLAYAFKHLSTAEQAAMLLFLERIVDLMEVQQLKVKPVLEVPLLDIDEMGNADSTCDLALEASGSEPPLRRV